MHHSSHDQVCYSVDSAWFDAGGAEMAVRWDAVVKDDGFWAQPAGAASNRPAANADSGACVQVWLFGSLADGIAERPVALQLNSPFCIGDVIAELGRRYGAALPAMVVAQDGAKVRNCRVFVNGEPVADFATPVQAGTSPAQVELILLSALEGG